MDRAEKAGLGVAFAGHIALFGLLSVGFLATPNPSMLKNDPMDVQFVDEVGLTSTVPEPAIEDPAQSVAPELGIPEDSAPPAPAEDEPSPAPPRPAEAARPQPKAQSRERLERPNVTPERQKQAERPRGSRLGSDFRKGLAAAATEAKGQRPRAAVGAQAMSSIAAAIRRQVQPCYELGALAGTAAMDIVTVLRLRFRKDGSVASVDLVEQEGVTSENRSYARQMAELSRRAVLRCSPLNLPEQYYEGGWDDFDMGFIPRQLG